MNSLTEYVVGLIEQDARKVIKGHESITVKDDIFDRFMSACEAAETPNQKLREAAEFAKGKGF